MVKNFVCFFCLTLFFTPAFCFANTPDLTGLWRTYDLQGHARSIVRFYGVNGEFRAEVIKDLTNNSNPPPVIIVYGLKAKGSEWVDGKIIDTDSGNTYNCSIVLSEDGKVMHLHAYEGLPIFGKTIDWERELITPNNN